MTHRWPLGRNWAQTCSRWTGSIFLLICDYFSKYPIVTPLHATTSENITEEIRKAVSMLADPMRVSAITDHSTSGNHSRTVSTSGASNTSPHPPGSHSSHTYTERQVQTIKKCKKEKQSLHLAMLDLRATPVDSKLPSPAEILMGRPITTLLPSPTSPSPVTVAQRQHLDRR